MKPTTLIGSMLLAGVIAGVALQIPTSIKTAFAPGAIAANATPGARAPSDVQTSWPLSTKVLVLRHEGDNYIGYLPLRNTSQLEQCVFIDAHVEAAGGAQLPVTVEHQANPFQIGGSQAMVQKVDLSLKDSAGKAVSIPGTGFLRIFAAQATGTPPTCTFAPTWTYSDQEIRVPEGPLMGQIFLGALLTTLIVVGVTAVNLLRHKICLFHVMGGVNWAFDKSWGANVTLGSALLMTLIGLTTFPERPQLMSKPSYTLLQILFGALVSLAPLVYNLIRREVLVSMGGLARVDVQGYVVMFLIAGGLVLWAALGQVATLAVLTQEFILGGTLEAHAGLTLEGLAVLLYLLLLVYGFRSLYKTAKTVSAPSATIGGSRPGPQMPSAPGSLPSAMFEWSIL